MDQKCYALALAAAEGAGPVLLKHIKQEFGHARRAWEAAEQEWSARGFSASSRQLFRKPDQLQRAADLLDLHRRNGLEPLTIFDASYPQRLLQIPDPPPVIYLQGLLDQSRRLVGVVGTRRMTDYGRAFLEGFIAQLKPLGVTVISGLAYGVDGMAHQRCVQEGVPTVGVLAHGLDRIYPAKHRTLAAEMVARGGGLITEFPLKTEVHPALFIRRNRILAGLVDVLVVVESASKGGALITARLANGYNREVLALTGPAGAVYSRGCHQLIKQQEAHLLEGVDDLIRVMNWDQTRTAPLPALTSDEKAVMELLQQRGPQNFDAISLRLQVSAPKLSTVLLNLELKKCISSLPGNHYRSL